MIIDVTYYGIYNEKVFNDISMKLLRRTGAVSWLFVEQMISMHRDLIYGVGEERWYGENNEYVAKHKNVGLGSNTVSVRLNGLLLAYAI